MFSIRKPTPELIRNFLMDQADREFSYNHVGATAIESPVGYEVDRFRITLGHGEEAFEEAKLALESWQQFRIGWLGIWPSVTPIREGEVVSVVARSFGLWWLNSCRIIYVIDEAEPIRRFGFAYGTLPDHIASGEERFLIEMDESGAVWYEIYAFSRVNRVLPRIGYPYVRRAQKRFARQSAARMRQLVLECMDVATTT